MIYGFKVALPLLGWAMWPMFVMIFPETKNSSSPAKQPKDRNKMTDKKDKWTKWMTQLFSKNRQATWATYLEKSSQRQIDELNILYLFWPKTGDELNDTFCPIDRKVYNWMTDIAEDQHQLDIRTTDAWQGNADIKQGDDLSDDKINVSEPYLIPQTSRVGLTKPLPSSARGTWCRSLDPSKVSLFVCLSVHQSVLPSIPRR